MYQGAFVMRRGVFLKVESNIFPVKPAEAYEVVEAYMHSFLVDCSK